jgi:hypothetical protein
MDVSIVSNFLCKLEVCSYNFQVAEKIWVCENGTVTKWQGDIQTYKDHLKEKIVRDKASSKKQFK